MKNEERGVNGGRSSLSPWTAGDGPMATCWVTVLTNGLAHKYLWIHEE